MVRVVLGIAGGQEPTHQIIVEVKGEEINIESCIEELRAMLIRWATTWLKYPDFEVAIKNRTGRPFPLRPTEGNKGE